MRFLKQSTAVTLHEGVFLDSGDADTEETGLSIAAADVKISKAFGALAAKNESTAPSHDANGHYFVPLNTTDTNTLGSLKVYIHKSGALPVWSEYMVVPANVYDSLISGSDKLDVNAAEIAGATPAIPTAVQISTDILKSTIIVAFPNENQTMEVGDLLSMIGSISSVRATYKPE